MSQLEAELASVVRQMETHRTQIAEHQQKLSLLEKRHAEIISTLSAHAIGASRSPASAAAEKLEQSALEDNSSFDASTARLKDLIEAASGDASRKEAGSDDVMNGSMVSSTLSASVARATQRAE